MLVGANDSSSYFLDLYSTIENAGSVLVAGLRDLELALYFLWEASLNLAFMVSKSTFKKM